MSSPIAGQTQLEEPDVVGAWALHPLPRVVRLSTLLFTGSVATHAVTIWIRERRVEWNSAGTAVFGLLALTLLLPWLMRVAARIKLAAEPSTRLELELDDTGYRVGNEHGDTATRWQGLEHWRESPTAFLLYSSRVMPQIVPKRAFEGEDVARLRTLIGAHAKLQTGSGCLVIVMKVLAGVTVLSFVASLFQLLRT